MNNFLVILGHGFGVRKVDTSLISLIAHDQRRHTEWYDIAVDETSFQQIYMIATYREH